MNIAIDYLYNVNPNFSGNSESADDNEFRSALDAMLSGNVIISPKIEQQLFGDSELADQTRQKLTEALRELGGELENGVLLINRRGEVSKYTFRKDELKHPTAEELKAVARARARKKARLDAYFHLLERVSIKRKLVEQENAKRFLNKKYRLSATRLDITARARQITAPPMNPDYFF